MCFANRNNLLCFCGMFGGGGKKRERQAAFGFPFARCSVVSKVEVLPGLVSPSCPVAVQYLGRKEPAMGMSLTQSRAMAGHSSG